MKGWDFSFLQGRWIEEEPPWNFKKMIQQELGVAQSLLDLGTGGGEFLSSLVPLVHDTIATEGYKPNLITARNTLRRFGVDIVFNFCDDNNLKPQRGSLPFRTNSLDLVIDRHESFIAAEVYRVLKRGGGLFLTQQVGTENLSELNEALETEKRESPWNLAECQRQLSEVTSDGFEIIDAREAKLRSSFKDVGAIVCFLLAAPWQVPGFTIDEYLTPLRGLHERIEKDGEFVATGTRFYVKARKK